MGIIDTLQAVAVLLFAIIGAYLVGYGVGCSERWPVKAGLGFLALSALNLVLWST